MWNALVYGLAYGLSLLPFWILYGIADLLWALVWYVVRYRKKVVLGNLRHAFPEKTEKERRAIARRFYRAFIDNFLEAIKLLTISRKELEKRLRVDYSLIDRLLAEGKSCQLHLGHVFNWEYANAHFAAHCPADFLVVYMPMTAKATDRIFRRLRERFGTKLLSATNMRKDMMPYRNKLYALTLVADQNPGNPAAEYWYDFMGRPAPFVRGPEKNARFTGNAVIFVRIRKTQRGYYNAEILLASEDVGALPDGELTRRFVRFLEDEIRGQPENWLWSHRRWKHKQAD